MSVSKEDLLSRMLDLYPEFGQFGLSLDLSYDDSKEAWIATVTKGEHQLFTHLEKEDVESCLQGRECYHFGVQLGQFIRYYCEDGSSCRL
ncbi:MAG: hypothetical protein V5B78_06540 [Desulfohalobiaceae bacterium]